MAKITCLHGARNIFKESETRKQARMEHPQIIAGPSAHWTMLLSNPREIDSGYTPTSLQKKFRLFVYPNSGPLQSPEQEVAFLLH